MTELLTREAFDPFVGEGFSIDGLPFDLVLSEIEDLPSAGADEGRKPFSLIFTGPKPGPVLRDGIYKTTVGDRATFELYIAPVHTPQADRQDYQSLFN